MIQVIKVNIKNIYKYTNNNNNRKKSEYKLILKLLMHYLLSMCIAQMLQMTKVNSSWK